MVWLVLLVAGIVGGILSGRLPLNGRTALVLTGSPVVGILCSIWWC